MKLLYYIYIYYIIAHSDISMKLHSFGQQNIQIQEISQEIQMTIKKKVLAPDRDIFSFKLMIWIDSP